MQLADGLDLNEVEAAKLLLHAQQDADNFQRSPMASAVVQFHEKRQLLLECLRLVLKQSADADGDEEHRDILRQLVSLILETKDGPARNGSLFAQKCMIGMEGVETWLQILGDRYQGSLTIGQSESTEKDELILFQQASLSHQHESLGAIVTHLVEANYTAAEDFHKLLDHLPRLTKWNSLAVHYIPAIIALISQHGSPEGTSGFREAKMIHQKLVSNKDSVTWSLRNLQAAIITWWLAEYSGWYLEPHIGSPMHGVDLEAEMESRSKAFLQALKDGAFQCTLSVCSQIKPSDWYDPARNGLTRFLLKDTPALPREVMFSSLYFQELVMEHIQTFVEAFVTNMPDTLRRFKTEEDDQRRKILSTLQADTRNSITEQDLHLERFLVLSSYAFDQRINAAETFWADPDGNLYGFLQWAAKRQSTPRASAFCELLRAISNGEDCASSAHRFLIEEGNSTSRIRRTSSISWTLIFEELNIYTTATKDSSGTARSMHSFAGKSNSGEVDEPESGLMLECYLRLTAHICRESTEARSWMLHHPTVRVLDSLFLLSSNTIPSRIQACAFSVVQALLTGKTAELGMFVWTSLDHWVSGGLGSSTGVARPGKVAVSPIQSEAAIFDLIAKDFEASCEFINLLQSLIAPSTNDSELNDSIPFPEQLGSTYRAPGIEPYIDFVFGTIFVVTTQEIDDPLNLRILRCSVLDFAATCLATFNEDLVVLANRSNIAIDNAMSTSSLTAYVLLHPFARVMEWMFNEKVLAALFAAAQQDINEVSNSPPDSPLLVSVLRCIDVMNLIMNLQSTYLEIARPQIKTHAVGRRNAVLNPALASFEDSVSTHLGLITDLAMYAGVGNQSLSLSSLSLLEKLSSSRRLNHQLGASIGHATGGNRLVEVLEQEDQVDQVSSSLIRVMQFDFRELAEGGDAPGLLLKGVILDFLHTCLISSLGRPTLAHALLGFRCRGSSIDIPSDGLFVAGISLFHAVVDLVVEYPDDDGDSMLPWALNLKQKGLRVLAALWSSPLTAIFTLTELRTSDFLFALFLKQQTIGLGTIWSGRSSQQPEFLYSESSLALCDFLSQRRMLFEYTSAEIRLLADETAPSLKARIVSTLLGTTTLPNGNQEPNPSILDLFDFSELAIPDALSPPALKYFANVDFSIGANNQADSNDIQYNLKMVEELLALSFNELRISGRLHDHNEEQRVAAEFQDALIYFEAWNQCSLLRSAKLWLLKAWSDTVKLLVSYCDLDQSSKSSLIYRSLQVVNPRLERFSEENTSEALELAKVVQTLLTQLGFDTLANDPAKAEDLGNDKLSQTFRTAIRAIHVPNGPAHLHEVLYNICHRYLAGTSVLSNASARRRHDVLTIKSAGGVLIEILCDDAYGGSGTCRISALLLLDSLVALANADKSSYIIDSLLRTNSIVLFVETISDIPQELRATDRKGK